jgi:N-acetyl sugar amidotransferase
MENTYKMCALSVMDTTTSLIRFDKSGVSNFVHDFNIAAKKTIFRNKSELDAELSSTVSKLKAFTSPEGYNCVLGLSGGVDSTYLAWFCKLNGIVPLCVHFDNGWNTEIAVKNIYSIVEKLGYDLKTFVIDWEEFSDIQLAYFKASVMDLEVPTDQFIFGALNKIAYENGIKYILSGNNIATEFVIPYDWKYDKFDLVNLKAIHKLFGKGKLRKLPALGKNQMYFYKLAGIETVQVLDLVNYKKLEAIDVITRELGWKNYGDKHQESVFTRWFQGYYLPVKFGIDKRKAHLSNMILNGEMTREQALAKLAEPTYDPILQAEDNVYVAKKWGLTPEEFQYYFSQPTKAHSEYPNDKTFLNYQKQKFYKKLMRAPLQFRIWMNKKWSGSVKGK